MGVAIGLLMDVGLRVWVHGGAQVIEGIAQLLG